MQRKIFEVILGGVALICSAHSIASIDQNFGLGGSSSARVGGVTATPESGFAASFNPALIGVGERTTLNLSTSYVRTDFSPIAPVLTDSPERRTENGSPRKSSLQIPAKTMAVWSVGLESPFTLRFWGNRNAGVGVVVNGPYEKLRSFTAGTPYEFTPLRYGSTDAQLKANVGASIEIVPKTLFFGAGALLYLSSAGEADAALVATNPTARLAVDVGLNSSLITGLYGAHGRTRASLVFRQEVSPHFEQAFNGRVQVGGVETVGQPVVFRSTLYFEPQSLESDVEYDSGPAKVSVGVSLQFWNRYRPHFIYAETQSAGGVVAVTKMPKVETRNTVNPRLSVEVPIVTGRLSATAGYQYRPSPVSDLSGEHNLVDSETHLVGVGVRFRMPANEVVATPMDWMLHGQLHRANPREVLKNDAQLIGAPGYRYSAISYSYGISLRAEL